MNISQQIPHWRVVAASVCGTSHIKNSQLCQDAHHWQILPDDILVVAAADGAGSARLGKVGAMVAVEVAVESISLREITQKTLAEEERVRSLLSEALLAAKKAVEEEAVACGAQPQDLASTLIIVIATPEMVAVTQIGDGVAVAKDGIGNLKALTIPDNGEYINQTNFLTSVGALDTAQVNLWRETVVNVGVLTDGLQMLAMNMAIGVPHKPFFFPLFDFIGKAEDKTTAGDRLVRFLRSQKITQRTDDDLTLILAAFSSS